jgi:putative transposase
MTQVVRPMTAADGASWASIASSSVTGTRSGARPYAHDSEEAGIRVVQTPYRAPNANAHAERFVRSIREECLDRLIPIGEHFRRAISEYVAHYHRERNHQRIASQLIEGAPASSAVGPIRRPPRLGGLLNYYERAA